MFSFTKADELSSDVTTLQQQVLKLKERMAIGAKEYSKVFVPNQAPN
jgi:outer membrane murein-binding lipoprotein Lpp